ncbi:MAG TPA: PGPGW domain-containing protein [Verrucomicrobiae bacterium]|nr:PGPGW domain-containing protein [Verrucomicrobiae bacterium]
MGPAHARSGSAKWRHILHLDALSPSVRKTIIGIVGGVVLLVGLALLFLPGPAFVVIPLGLAILASEFAWARLYVKKARKWFERGRDKYRRHRDERRSRRSKA